MTAVPAAGVAVPGPGERVRTVFLGSGAFGGPALRMLAAHPAVHLVGVVTAPPRPVGRTQAITQTPIGALADELGLAPVLTPARLRAPESIAAVLALDPVLVILVDYGQIVPAPILDLPFGALNLHPSALPRWRGAAPVPATILAGDPAAAVALMRMDTGLDTGPLLATETATVDGDETTPELEARLASLGASLLARSLAPWLAGALPAVPQAADGVTLTRPLRREDGRLDPAEGAAALERRVRAYAPWPGTFLELDGERLVVNAAAVEAGEPGDVPGVLVRIGDRPALATADGRLVLGRVTPPGRKQMSGADWLRGRRSAG